MSMPPVLVSYIPWLDRFGLFLYTTATSLGGLGILLVAVLDSSFLTLPEGNDLLIVILAAGSTWEKMTFYVGVTILGSLLGCFLLYTVGLKGGSPVLKKRFSSANIERAEKLFARYGILTVVIPSILPPPCPFKIFVLSAGVFRLSLIRFALAVTVGRTIRYSIWGILAVLYGNPVRLFIERNLAAVGILLFVLFVVVIGTVVVSYVASVRRGRRASLGA